MTNYLEKYIFHLKIQLFVTAKSDQDLDPDPHWLGSLDPDPDLETHRGKKLDPDPEILSTSNEPYCRFPGSALRTVFEKLR
jgi:hypothetical protein